MAKLKLSRETVAQLTQVLANFTQSNNVRDIMFDRMQYVDRSIQREVNRTAEYVKSRIQHRNGNRKPIGEIDIPVTLAQVDTAHARLVAMFLSGQPVFGCTSENPELQDTALMMHGLSKRDQVRFGWIPNLSLSLNDSLKYLFAAVEVKWADIKRFSVRTNTSNSNAAMLESKNYSGNSIRRLDPYNLFFDPTVPLHEVHSRGAYAGYVECLNYINAKLLLTELNKEYAITANYGQALGTAAGTSLYRRPDAAQPTEVADASNWSIFWGAGAKNAGIAGHKGQFEKVVLYVKLIPEEYGIAITNGGTPTIFQLQWLNGTLIYVEPLENAHGMLPIVIGTGNDDGLGLQSKSMAEQLTDFQEMLSALTTGTFTSMRRAVGDRALYDPQRIKATDIDSANPVAKIPVRLNQFNKDLQSAYYAIPYRDEVTPYFMQNYGFINNIAQQVTGLNPSAQGAFIKGNRTQGEYQDVQSNSDSRTQKYGMTLEATLFAPIKYILKLNYLQYAKDEELVLQDEKQAIQVDVGKLRQRDMDFDMTDGLNPASRMMNNDVMVAAMNTIAQTPELEFEYSRARIFGAMVKSAGFHIERYRKTPEEQQQYMAQQQAMAAAEQSGAR